MLDDLFKLEKLTIQSFKNIERNDPLKSDLLGANEMEVMYNPSSLATKYESSFEPKDGAPNHSTTSKWLNSRGKELTVALLFDGTNVSYYGIELLFGVRTVAEWVRGFLELCYDVHSDTHEPAYLRLMWGKGIFGDDGFDCRLKSVDVNYTAFDRDGSPLRASLTAVFIEALDPPKEKAKLQLSSPDLTHHRMVRSGDTLPQLCREIYGSSHHYLRVAEVNQLDDFRRLQPGTELIFPPFDRRGRA